MGKPGSVEQEDELPVHIVTDPSQLPLEFLEPSQNKQVAVGFDCEGVSLSREGRLTLIQVRCPSSISSGC